MPLEIPDHLEEVFLVQGPFAFSDLIEAAGGKTAAAKAAGVSVSTLSRWSSAPPGRLFGQRRDLRSYRSMWFGYPPPFPALDRIVEEMFDDEDSFFGRAVDNLGIRGVFEAIEEAEWRVSSSLIGGDVGAIREAAKSVRIPRATRTRLEQGVPYPRQWIALDRLCTGIEGRQVRWLEYVLAHVHSPTRRVPKGALFSMICDLDLSA